MSLKVWLNIINILIFICFTIFVTKWILDTKKWIKYNKKKKNKNKIKENIKNEKICDKYSKKTTKDYRIILLFTILFLCFNLIIRCLKL